MSTHYPQLTARVGRTHPAVVNRRMHELLGILLAGLIPLALGLAITVEDPKPDPILIFGIMLGLAAVVALLLSSRYTVTLTLVALYLGLLDGPVKMESASKAASGVRDVLIIAVALGMIMRLAVKKDHVRLPPLAGWVIGFVAVVLVEALNPHTNGILKSIGGYRQQLEWVPFFFFGYLMVRSKQRFRQLFLILGVIALANGVVGAVQARISPGELASWGPGYSGLVHGGSEGTGLTGRTYKSEGETRARPPALGSDSGFGGGVGVIALPGLLALLAAGRLRRRWPVLLLCVGALLGIATAASRTSVVSGVVALVCFGLLSLVAGLRVGRPLVGLMVVIILASAVGSILVAADGKGVFARQESLTSLSKTNESGASAKERNLSEIPSDLIHGPFGYGLGTAGSVSGFGGHQRLEVEGQRISGGSAYALLMKELGFPGLFLWVGLSTSVFILAVRWLRQVADPQLRTYLVGLLAAFAALTVQGLSGPTLAVTSGAFLWFVPGVIAYWFAGAGLARIRTRAAGGGRAAGSAIAVGAS
jgi:hypothetical protein